MRACRIICARTRMQRSHWAPNTLLQVTKAAATAVGRRSSLDGGGGGTRRRRSASLDGGLPAAATASAATTSSHHTRQRVPKAVANALWRRDCGEVLRLTYTVL